MRTIRNTIVWVCGWALGPGLGLQTETISQFIGFGLGVTEMTEPNRYDERDKQPETQARTPAPWGLQGT